MNTGTHDATHHCEPVHCFFHHIDEAGDGYLRCGECFHLWRSKGELTAEYRREFWRHNMQPWWRKAWHVITVRADKIAFCQWCLHDF